MSIVMFVKFCLRLKDFKIENVNYQLLLSKVQSPKQYFANNFYNLLESRIKIYQTRKEVQIQNSQKLAMKSPSGRTFLSSERQYTFLLNSNPCRQYSVKSQSVKNNKMQQNLLLSLAGLLLLANSGLI